MTEKKNSFQEKITQISAVAARPGVGESGARLFDAAGRDVTGGFDERIVGVPLQALRDTPAVIATALVTDAALARRLLELAALSSS
ncbi:sugar-binding domain-containing protein [Jiangella muralis]|uniref:sugar-binding domain-containing protein n=1 Tax=Jiangella muralis TaxID=702383 RepID=UPI00069D4139|nr:sugar-binding domain-containing protein [Jiangella muralis]